MCSLLRRKNRPHSDVCIVCMRVKLKWQAILMKLYTPVLILSHYILHLNQLCHKYNLYLLIKWKNDRFFWSLVSEPREDQFLWQCLWRSRRSCSNISPASSCSWSSSLFTLRSWYSSWDISWTNTAGGRRRGPGVPTLELLSSAPEMSWWYEQKSKINIIWSV